MPRKGKKKKQQQDEKGASISSATTSNEPLQSPSISQQPQRLQETPQQQLQGVWAKRQQQQMQAHSLQQQSRGTLPKLQQQQRQTPMSLSQQQTHIPMSPPQQQHIPMRPPQQQQHIPMSPPQQQMQQIIRSPPQHQQISTHPSEQQSQVVYIRPQQQQIPMNPSQQQQQGALGRLQQQQQRQVPTSLPQQQQRTWTQVTQQQHQVPMSPPQQQMQQISIYPSQQRSQGIDIRPQQQQIPMNLLQQQHQIPMNLPQQQMQQISTYPSQQRSQGIYIRPQQQQIPMNPPQQQMQQISTYPSQQRSQGIYIRPQQQQIPINLSQQQHQIPMNPPQQQMLMSPPQYQQQILMSTSQQQWQQVPSHLSQQQPQGVYIRPQQQQIPTNPLQQQQQGALDRLQQQQQRQVSMSSSQQQQKTRTQVTQQQQQIPMNPLQQQQQGALDQSRQQQQQQQMPTNPQQQQQRVSVDTSDAQQTQAIQQDNFEPQSSTSTELLKVSTLSLRNPLQSIKTSTNEKLEPSQKTQNESSIPTRKSFMKGGTPNRNIKVKTNMFEICFGKDFISNAVQYDVKIEPKASKLMYKKVFEECRKSYFGQRYPAYDGKKSAYSANDLPIDNELENEITIENKKFTIALKRVNDKIDLSWIRDLQCNEEKNEEKGEQVAVQVLDIIFRHAAERIHFSLGRSIFFEDTEYLKDNNINLDEKLCLRKGGYLSAVAGWKAYLNVDVAHKVFFSPKNVADIIDEFQKFNSKEGNWKERRDLTNEQKKEIDKFLKNLKVSYEIPGQKNLKRTYRVNQIGPSADEHTFQHNGNSITIAKYFQNHKQYKLKHPYLPCLWVGAKERVDKIYLPAELCHVMPNQPYVRKLDNQQTIKMIKNTAIATDNRQRQIEMAFKKIDVNESPILKEEFKLSVNAEPKEVDARVLSPPRLRYSTKTAEVKRGTWQISAFKQAKSIKSWAIFNLIQRMNPHVQQLGEKLKNHALSLGMTFETNPKIEILRKNDLQHCLNKYKKYGVKLVIVIIPNDSDTYCMVKRISELTVGLLTQCIKADTANKIINNTNSATTLNNLFLKINSKLNGINHTFFKMPTILQNNPRCMLVGADVSHPSPDSESNLRSIAAVTASQDTVAFQYNVELRTQTAKQETIDDFKDIMISQISNYHKKTNHLPEKIIYYRDGVSEGQFASIINHEINAIKTACSTFNTIMPDADKVKITCLVVQKRHHVRLFPSNPRESDDKCMNVRAGTIVDTEITHPNQFDFYLVSHPSIQGTARPTRYRCIYNDSKDYSDEDLEELTYYLCHMYARCTRAVSYPAPTYYAHLAAYRGRNWMHKNNFEQKTFEVKLTESPMFFI